MQLSASESDGQCIPRVYQTPRHVLAGRSLVVHSYIRKLKGRAAAADRGLPDKQPMTAGDAYNSDRAHQVLTMHTDDAAAPPRLGSQASCLRQHHWKDSPLRVMNVLTAITGHPFPGGLNRLFFFSSNSNNSNNNNNNNNHLKQIHP